jgi:hypothetical protein
VWPVQKATTGGGKPAWINCVLYRLSAFFSL